MSGFIRTYGNVSFKYDDESRTKQLPLPPKEPEDDWEKVVAKLGGRGRQVRDMRELVLEVVGSDATPGQADTACLAFLQALLPLDQLNLEVWRRLKKEHGTLSQGQTEKIFRSVKELVKDLEEEEVDALSRVGQEEELGPMFGENIPFTAPSEDIYDCLDLSYLHQVEEEKPAPSLSFRLDCLPAPASAPQPPSNSVDTDWLEDTLRKFYQDEQPLGISVSEFAITILDMLSSKRSSEDLQAELFDLCGFERFDMIGAVLENRESLVRSLRQNKVDMRAELSR